MRVVSSLLISSSNRNFKSKAKLELYTNNGSFLKIKKKNPPHLAIQFITFTCEKVDVLCMHNRAMQF